MWKYYINYRYDRRFAHLRSRSLHPFICSSEVTSIIFLSCCAGEAGFWQNATKLEQEIQERASVNKNGLKYYVYSDTVKREGREKDWDMHSPCDSWAKILLGFVNLALYKCSDETTGKIFWREDFDVGVSFFQTQKKSILCIPFSCLKNPLNIYPEIGNVERFLCYRHPPLSSPLFHLHLCQPPPPKPLSLTALSMVVKRSEMKLILFLCLANPPGFLLVPTTIPAVSTNTGN